MAEDTQPRERGTTADDNSAEAPLRRETVHDKAQEEFADIVGAKEDRKVRAREHGQRSVWFGFGMFGLVGWSVAVPAVACIALGVWIDTRWPSPYSWTLMLLFVGIVLGCLNAWYWLARERNKLDI